MGGNAIPLRSSRVRSQVRAHQLDLREPEHGSISGARITSSITKDQFRYSPIAKGASAFTVPRSTLRPP